MDRRSALKNLALSAGGLAIAPSLSAQIFNDSELKRSDFGAGFQFGVATAAYQIEGAWNADGKGPSIWDEFTHRKKNVKNGANGDVACDFYNRFPDDLRLMRSMNIPNHRFSVSWSRIFPDGIGEANEKGLDFYDRLVDKTLANRITPWITCYHWDLPQALQEKGGWTNRDCYKWFGEYVDRITRRLGDRVSNWIVMNEPMAFVGLGYVLGMHAPGLKGFKNFFPAVHHATMAQSEGARVIQSNVQAPYIGTTFSASHMTPKKDNPAHRKAVRKFDALWNRLFLEPALGRGYPWDDFKFLRRIEKHMQPGDEENLRFRFDFIGLQNYTREVVKKSLWPPALWAKFQKPEKRGDDVKITEMNWEVYPEGIYHLLKKFGSYKEIPEIIVTENGAAFPDRLENGEVNDEDRLKYIQDYLRQVLRAKKEGVRVAGYFIWTFMDNFEWAEGYHPRFGLVHVDFESQKRTIKKSGKWFQDFLSA